jgi:hypothetical protein
MVIDQGLKGLGAEGVRNLSRVKVVGTPFALVVSSVSSQQAVATF